MTDKLLRGGLGNNISGVVVIPENGIMRSFQELHLYTTSRKVRYRVLKITERSLLGEGYTVLLETDEESDLIKQPLDGGSKEYFPDRIIDIIAVFFLEGADVYIGGKLLEEGGYAAIVGRTTCGVDVCVLEAQVYGNATYTFLQPEAGGLPKEAFWKRTRVTRQNPAHFCGKADHNDFWGSSFGEALHVAGQKSRNEVS